MIEWWGTDMRPTGFHIRTLMIWIALLLGRSGGVVVGPGLVAIPPVHQDPHRLSGPAMSTP